VVGEGGGLVSESTINVLSLVDVHALSISYYCRYSYAWVQIAIFALSQVSQPQLIGAPLDYDQSFEVSNPTRILPPTIPKNHSDNEA
jgi:hypothetical protein